MPKGTRIVLRGCLDGLSEGEIAARPPIDGDDTLYTRLPNGRDVKLSKRHVIEHAPAAFALLRRDGADAILFNCTGEFPPIPGDTGVVFPSRVLNGMAEGLLARGRLGLLVPLAEQIPTLAQKWSRPGLEVVAEAVMPSADAVEMRSAARRLAARRPDLVALDCMSFTPAAKEIVRAATGVPAILGITAAARVLCELME
jgi:protein AroM